MFLSKTAPTLYEALEDVEARFIYPLPTSELSQPERLLFQIEQAYWYYEDYKADKYDSLPHFNTLKSFASTIFQHCKILKDFSSLFKQIFADFANYKAEIPACGCIMVNPSMTKIVLVRTYDGKNWTFPRGKLNEGETELECAIREVFEETGFNTAPHCNENDFFVSIQDRKKLQMYIASNVPEDTVFSIMTRKEISDVKFHPIDNLPSRTYHVHPFIPNLKRWIKKKKSEQNNSNKSNNNISASNNKKPVEKKEKKKKEKTSNTRSKSNIFRNNFDSRNAATFATADKKGWSVNDMFEANKKITGRLYEYDGNPHNFGDWHPKYVNYVEKEGQAWSSGGNNIDEEYSMLINQSLRLGEKVLHGRDMDDLQLPSSITSNKNGKTFFKSFKLDTNYIMEGFDEALTQHPIQI